MRDPSPEQDRAVYDAYWGDDDATHESVAALFGLSKAAVDDAIDRVRRRRADRMGVEQKPLRRSA